MAIDQGERVLDEARPRPVRVTCQARGGDVGDGQGDAVGSLPEGEGVVGHLDSAGDSTQDRTRSPLPTLQRNQMGKTATMRAGAPPARRTRSHVRPHGQAQEASSIAAAMTPMVANSFRDRLFASLGNATVTVYLALRSRRRWRATTGSSRSAPGAPRRSPSSRGINASLAVDGGILPGGRPVL